MDTTINSLRHNMLLKLIKIKAQTKNQHLIELINEYEAMVKHKPKIVKVKTDKLDITYIIER